MTRLHAVRLTANFERNLGEIEGFLNDAEAPQAFDSLLEELLETVIPNLERFTEMGRPFMRQPTGSVETANVLAGLRQRLLALTRENDAIREYVLKNYLLLYALIDGTIHLLAIRHQRQLSFDFPGHWQAR